MGGYHRGRLDHRGDNAARECGAEAVGGQFCQEVLDALAGDDFQRPGHLVHAVQKQGQSSTEVDQHDTEFERVVHCRRCSPASRPQPAWS